MGGRYGDQDQGRGIEGKAASAVNRHRDTGQRCLTFSRQPPTSRSQWLRSLGHSVPVLPRPDPTIHHGLGLPGDSVTLTLL